MRQWLMGLIVGAMIGGVSGAGVAGLVKPRATGAAPEEQQRQYIHELKVDRLLVTDASGQERIRLQVADNGAEVVVMDPNGRARIALIASGTASVLQIQDPSSLGDPAPRRRVQVTVDDKGAGLSARDAEVGGVGLGVGTESSTLGLTDPNGNVRAGLAASGSISALTLWDPPLGQASREPRRTAQVVLRDEGAGLVAQDPAVGTVRMQVNPERGARVAVLDQDQQALWSAP